MSLPSVRQAWNGLTAFASHPVTNLAAVAVPFAVNAAPMVADMVRRPPQPPKPPQDDEDPRKMPTASTTVTPRGAATANMPLNAPLTASGAFSGFRLGPDTGTGGAQTRTKLPGSTGAEDAFKGKQASVASRALKAMRGVGLKDFIDPAAEAAGHGLHSAMTVPVPVGPVIFPPAPQHMLG